MAFYTLHLFSSLLLCFNNQFVYYFIFEIFKSYLEFIRINEYRSIFVAWAIYNTYKICC